MSSVEGTWGLRCPKCELDDMLRVEARFWVGLDGEDDDITPTRVTGFPKWDAASACACDNCEWVGTVADADVGDKEDEK